MLDLTTLDQERRRWIQMSGALTGVELEVRHSGPKEQERFRQALIRSGVMKPSPSGVEINSGREADFFKAYAEKYVTGWRGDIQPEGAPYDAAKMGAVLGAVNGALEQITRALGEEADFFPQSGGGSIG
jgi:hypothetical protein